MGEITNRQEETCQDDGYVHYLDCGDAFTGMCINQNSL